MRRHVKQVTALKRMRFARQEKFAFAGQNLDNGMLCGRVFGKFLPFGETEKHNARICSA